MPAQAVEQTKQNPIWVNLWRSERFVLKWPHHWTETSVSSVPCAYCGTEHNRQGQESRRRQTASESHQSRSRKSASSVEAQSQSKMESYCVHLLQRTSQRGSTAKTSIESGSRLVSVAGKQGGISASLIRRVAYYVFTGLITVIDTEAAGRIHTGTNLAANSSRVEISISPWFVQGHTKAHKYCIGHEETQEH